MVDSTNSSGKAMKATLPASQVVPNRAKKTPQTAKPAARAFRPAKSSPPQQPKTSSLPRLKRPVPAASVAKAKEAFKTFSLSKFAGNVISPNFVAAGQSPAPAQQRIISQQINKLNDAGASARAMTIALPDATIQQLLPSFDVKAGTIDLGEVMSLIQHNMRGTEFYAQGNPTLNRLAIQSQVQQIIESVKQDAKK